jgi:hypothetical protein
MEDTESDDVAKDRPGPGEPIREASTTTDKKDAELVYIHTRLQRDKVRRRYFRYYHGCRIIVERGDTIEEFDEHTLRVWGSAGCPGVDRHGRESLPYDGSDCVGVLREPPPETWRLIPHLAQADSDRGDPDTH